MKKILILPLLSLLLTACSDNSDSLTVGQTATVTSPTVIVKDISGVQRVAQDESNDRADILIMETNGDAYPVGKGDTVTVVSLTDDGKLAEVTTTDSDHYDGYIPSKVLQQ
jgi:ABC-type Fe3+-hydroxamate transport system substrate-binding protein